MENHTTTAKKYNDTLVNEITAIPIPDDVPTRRGKRLRLAVAFTCLMITLSYIVTIKLEEIDRLRKVSTKLCSELDNYYVEHKHELTLIENRMRELINEYDADKIGLIDHALASAGGCVISTPNTEPFDYESVSPPTPNKILQPNTQPGECFAIKGAIGRIRIKLSAAIVITRVTLEHVHSAIVADVRSAPKQFAVIGLEHKDQTDGYLLGSFVYNVDKDIVRQTFNIVPYGGREYEYIELYITSNHGHPDYTCIYRFRVHSQ